MSFIQVTTIGRSALEILKQAKQISFRGQSAKGLFLEVDQQRIVFISLSHFPGPLTLNVEPAAAQIQLPVFNSTTRITTDHGDLIFHGISRFTFSQKNTRVWAAAQPSRERPNDIQVLNRLSDALEYLLNNNDSSPLLAALFAMEAYDELPDNNWKDKLDNIRNSFMEMDWNWLKSQLIAFLGIGSGLTPSGDDFVLGFLLALNRFPSHFEVEWLERINHDVVEAAEAKTNTISASLIRCAAEGQADQRLVQAIDDIVLTEKPIEESAAPLLSWGSSSGCDAFVGMYLGVELVVGIKAD
jgi:hypothetical protein